MPKEIEHTLKNTKGSSTLPITNGNAWNRDILGVRMDFGLDKKEFFNRVTFAIKNQLCSYVSTVNPEFIMHAQSHPDFKDALNDSYLNVPDGAGVLMAERYLSLVEAKEEVKSGKLTFLEKLFLGCGVGLSSALGLQKIGVKLPGSELIYDICEFAAENGYTVMFLGGWERDKRGRPMPTSGNLAGRTANILKNKFPKLNVIFASSDIKYSAEYDDVTLKEIKSKMLQANVSRIDIAFVAFGHMKQENWMHRNLEKIPASLGIGLGGTFEFVTGYAPRAPKYVTSIHMEWLYRFVTEPWRVKRILTAFPQFPLKIFFSSLK